MKPAEKSKQVEEVLEKVSQDMYRRSRLDSINNDTCVSCRGPAKDFRDELSTKEFTISGFCQVCQDKTFGEEGGEEESPESWIPRWFEMDMRQEDFSREEILEMWYRCTKGLPGPYDVAIPCLSCKRAPSDDCFYEVKCNAHAVEPLVHKASWLFAIPPGSIFCSRILEDRELDQELKDAWAKDGYRVGRGLIDLLLLEKERMAIPINLEKV